MMRAPMICMLQISIGVGPGLYVAQPHCTVETGLELLLLHLLRTGSPAYSANPAVAYLSKNIIKQVRWPMPIILEHW